MTEPTAAQLRDQICKALRSYSHDAEKQVAMLSGISLAATFLAKLEGGKTRPQDVASAANAVARELGFVIGRLK